MIINLLLVKKMAIRLNKKNPIAKDLFNKKKNCCAGRDIKKK